VFYVISNGKCLFNTRRGPAGASSSSHSYGAFHERDERAEEGKRRCEREKKGGRAIVIYAEVSEQLR